MQDNLTVNMNGSEYLQYKKYIDERNDKRWKINLSTNQKHALLAFMLSAISLLGLFATYDIFHPTPTHEVVYTWNGILMFMAVALGLSWIVHGVGFVLVRVNK